MHLFSKDERCVEGAQGDSLAGAPVQVPHQGMHIRDHDRFARARSPAQPLRRASVQVYVRELLVRGEEPEHAKEAYDGPHGREAVQVHVRGV